ncbi:MAG: hypothetical protein COS95_00810 [Ignavibacteriales bacterium CG07_land_8_20_14_0_80_59_12]|nr:MAG: hypothetical protein COS95_00810 [Ignavibacteriales bacterium CG07_land_8_20_14_0_80_59_12]
MGKASLILVMGFAVIFSIIRLGFNRANTDIAENFVYYFDKESAHGVAVSAANMALAKLAETGGSWNAGYNNVDFTQNGKVKFAVNINRPYDVETGQQLTWVYCKGFYDTDTASVTVLLRDQPYSKYIMFNPLPGGFYATGDTIDGPGYMDNGQLWTRGRPVFKDRILLSQAPKVEAVPAGVVADFRGGWQILAPTQRVPNVGNASDLVSNAGYSCTKNLYLEFFVGADGKGMVKHKLEGEATYATDTLSVFAPSGVIAVNGNKDVHVKGTVKGKISIYATKDVWLDDDLVYAETDLTKSKDMLGVVAGGNINITDNAANNNNITVYGSLFAMSGNVQAEHYNTRPVSGTLHVIGGIIHEGFTATADAYNNITHGFHSWYQYDWRLLNQMPPHFPRTGRLDIISWLE